MMKSEEKKLELVFTKNEVILDDTIKNIRINYFQGLLIALQEVRNHLFCNRQGYHAYLFTCDSFFDTN